MQRKMQGKRGAAKGVTLPRRKDSPSKTVEKLPDNPTPDELRDAAVTISLADLEGRVADVRDSWETESLFEDTFEELINDETSASASGECLEF
jgi:NAD-dependent histone deacetylase SIR2